VESDVSSQSPIPHSSEALLILSYRTVTTPKRSRFAYFWNVFFAIIRLGFGICFTLGGLFSTIGGIIGLVQTGHPVDLACAAVVWGPVLMPLGIYWFMKAIDILDAGPDYNSRY
jgi:hypothetical protein